MIQTIAIRAALIAGALAACWAWGSYNHFVGHSAGRAAERAIWEAQMRDLRDRMDEERRAAQAEIDRAEREYLEARQADALLIAGLEAAIEEMETTDAETADSAGTVCRPAIPRALGMQLNQIGR